MSKFCRHFIGCLLSMLALSFGWPGILFVKDMLILKRLLKFRSVQGVARIEFLLLHLVLFPSITFMFHCGQVLGKKYQNKLLEVIDKR